MTWLLPPVLLLISAAAMIALMRAAPLASLLPEPANLVLGLPLAVAGLGLAVAAKRQFRRIGTTVNTFDAPAVLVRDGLFAYSRNPMYLGFCLALLGFAIKLNAASGFLVVLLFALTVDLWYIRHEERQAAVAFGEEYEAYRRRTRRWL